MWSEIFGRTICTSSDRIQRIRFQGLRLKRFSDVYVPRKRLHLLVFRGDSNNNDSSRSGESFSVKLTVFINHYDKFQCIISGGNR